MPNGDFYTGVTIGLLLLCLIAIAAITLLVTVLLGSLEWLFEILTH